MNEKHVCFQVVELADKSRIGVHCNHISKETMQDIFAYCQSIIGKRVKNEEK